MVFCVRKLATISDEEFFDYWLNQHGPLVLTKVDALGVRRYVQSHATSPEVCLSIAAGRGMQVPAYDGLAELWWEDMEALQGAFSTEAGQAASSALAEDEERFIDLEASTIFLTEEHVIVDG